MWEIMIMFCQEFLRTCLEVDIVQGFTMTEATCSGTLQPVGCKQVKGRIVSAFLISLLLIGWSVWRSDVGM